MARADGKRGFLSSGVANTPTPGVQRPHRRQDERVARCALGSFRRPARFRHVPCLPGVSASSAPETSPVRHHGGFSHDCSVSAEHVVRLPDLHPERVSGLPATRGCPGRHTAPMLSSSIAAPPIALNQGRAKNLPFCHPAAIGRHPLSQSGRDRACRSSPCLELAGLWHKLSRIRLRERMV